MNIDLIIFTGAPGTGKTTISKILHNKLDSLIIDFGKLREFHLDKKWKNANPKEEQMAFENLIFILRNYLKKGYKNIIVNDLKDDKALKLVKIFSKNKVILISLVVHNFIIRKRVSNPKRDSGFRNVNLAIKYNTRIIQRKLLKNELKIDNSHDNPKKTTNKILNYLKKLTKN